MDLIINSNLVIPSKELWWRFSRASGPGGQGVNTTDSRVELIFDIAKSSAISPFQKYQLMTTLDKHLVAGCLRVVVREERSQYQNRQLALKRLACQLREGMSSQTKNRKLTKPSLKGEINRVENKKKRGELKRRRQEKHTIDD